MGFICPTGSPPVWYVVSDGQYVALQFIYAESFK